MKITSCGITDIGRKRQRNEDSYLVNDKLALYIVADGMGYGSRNIDGSRLCQYVSGRSGTGRSAAHHYGI